MRFIEQAGLRWMEPGEPLFPGLRVVVTTRHGGASSGARAGLNLAGHVGDDPVVVAANRRRLGAVLDLPADPVWLRQVHGIDVADADAVIAAESAPPPVADAAVSTGSAVLAILTADCLPVVIAMPEAAGGGLRFGVAHAGWRGLAAGVLEATLEALEHRGGVRQAARAWLGPAIGPVAFEVGDEVRAAFLERDAAAVDAFRANSRGRWQADLFRLARRRLAAAGVGVVAGDDLCTFADPTRWYSHRRDARPGADTGRFATLAWMERGTLVVDSAVSSAAS